LDDDKTNIRFMIHTYSSINSENLVIIGPVLSEIFANILSEYFQQRYADEPCKLRGYWTVVFTRCSQFIAAVNAPVDIAVSQSVSEYQSNE